MNKSNPPNHGPFQPIWQLLVSLSEINIDPSSIQEKLQELTKRYSIPSDTSEKIIVSIQDSLLRAFETFDALRGERRVFVNIYISANAKERIGSNQDWGFFRIERMNTSLNPGEGRLYLIELYLYLDR